MSKRGERPMVPKADFTSYYGQSIINPPVWEPLDIAGYLFLGGLAGVSSLVAAGSDLTGRPALALTAKTGATAAAGLSLVALVHDLGRPTRFLHMLRVFKVVSPMSVGSWLLAAYVPAAGVAALTAWTRRLPVIGTLATGAAALLGSGVATYTAALIADTSVPAWHSGHRELPFVFVGSAATAAGGLGLLFAPLSESTPTRHLAVGGVAVELAAFERMRSRLGMVAESYSTPKARAFLRTAQVLAVAGAAGALLGRRSRVVTALSGAALIAASAATRWAVFHAGVASAEDPKYTVIPQRERISAAQRQARPE